MTDLRPIRTMLLEESQNAVDADYALWKQNRRSVARLLRLKNAVDHLYSVEVKLSSDDDHDCAFGGIAGR